MKWHPSLKPLLLLPLLLICLLGLFAWLLQWRWLENKCDHWLESFIS